MGVEEKPSRIPLKLSDVFSSDKCNQANSHHEEGENGNKEECKEKSISILNKYKVTEFNKREINKIYIKNEFFNNNRRKKQGNKVLNAGEEILVKADPANGSILKNEEEDDQSKGEENTNKHQWNGRKVHKQSNLFIANGTIGLVVHNGIMCLSMKGIQPFIITSAKNAFYVLDPHKLRKAYTSEYYTEDIKNLYCANGYVYVVFNKKIYKVNESGGKKIFSLGDSKHCILNILTVYDYLLSYSKKEIVIWNDVRKEVYGRDGFLSNSGSEQEEEEDEEEEEGEKKRKKKVLDEVLNEMSSEMVDEGGGVKKTGKGREQKDTYEGNNTNGKKSDKDNICDGYRVSKNADDCTSRKKRGTGESPQGNDTIRDRESHLFKCISLFDDDSEIEICSIVHPPGYINKVIILTNDNKIYLYNINKEKIIHEYISLNSINLSKEKYINIMILTSKKDELCIVTSTNELYIINTESDKFVYAKNIHMNDDKVSCVQFYNYTYNDENVPVILVGTEMGKIIMIDTKSSNYFILRNIHDCVKTILIAPQGDYIYTVGKRDNKVNLLNLHKHTFTLDIIKKRNSCVGIINNIKYLNDEKFKIVVSANDVNQREGNLYILNPHCPEQNKDFSWHKKISLINKTIIDFDINQNRHYDWNNILVCVKDSDRVYLASSYKKIIDNVYLSLPFDIMNKIPKGHMKKDGRRKDTEKEALHNAGEKERNGVSDGMFNWIHDLTNHIQEEGTNELKKEEYKIFDEYNPYEHSAEEGEAGREGEKKKKKKCATSVLISTCGHIGIIGYNDGEIHSFNMQSTTYRNSYKLNKYSIKSKAHLNGDILKLHLYGICNFLSASSCKEDTCLRVWNIYTSELTYSYNIKNEYIINRKIKNDKNNDEINIVSVYHFNILTVASLSNNHTIIIDIEQKCITRKFQFSHSVTNVTFSADNRLILFALSNNTLLIYEIISNTFIDYLLFNNDIISMIYNDIYLYTAHKNTKNFLYSFTNKNLFNNNNYVVNDYHYFRANLMEPLPDAEDNKTYNDATLGKVIGMDDCYSNSIDVLSSTVEETKNKNDSEAKIKERHNSLQLMETYKSSEKQINKNLMTLSGYSISKIAYIIFLDKIKENCTVQENVKKNEEIPFFLSAKLDKNIEYADDKEREFLQNISKGVEGGYPDQEESEEREYEGDETVQTVTDQLDVEADADTKSDAKSDAKSNAKSNAKSGNKLISKGNKSKSRHITKLDKIQMPTSKLQEILAKNEESYINVLNYLKELSPSGVHFNILCLSTKEELENMMNFFIYHVKTNDNIDLIQAYIFVFLKTHGKKLLKTKAKNLRNTTTVLLQEIQTSWSNINFLFENIIFFIKFLTNIQVE
ncbi:hypothetical protein, conserved [Plasmodium gonderi]|uniref:WDR36/Utp21 C-terminal domain-containing protein n=1 Tax=Plasmodium gonderi TaxID=77519 RepID=A0A1Y1JGN0_PLAGO|nr:hypothetical protein, conserved [Plasmodium gonderi]GAW81679.1 hypothetical protein, conserved [Plasmodium gonderi]